MTATAGEGRAATGPDAVAAAVALGLFALAAAVGAGLYLAGRPVHASAAPLFAHVVPHVGPGTPGALAIAGLVVWYGPVLAARLSWRRLLGLAYATAVSWTFALALVDGWHRGLAGRLTTRHEYLSEVPGVTDIGAMLPAFTARILDGQPDSWTTHVSGHPPGALLVFVALDRIGLGGGGWAAVLCVMVGASAAVTVPQTLRAIGAPRAARAAVPFLVLFPGAVWVGASADGLFTGVTCAGIALLALATRRRGPAGALAGTGAGLVLGFGCFLSYGLVLLAPIALAVVIVARRAAPIAYAALGATAVVAAFAGAGFWWLDGYHLVIQRYYQGIASDRPYGYWAWANLACLVVSAGPAAAPIIRRSVAPVVAALRRPAAQIRAGAAALRRPARQIRAGAAAPRRQAAGMPWQLMPVAALVAILLADMSGLSKAEVERIWLPFAIWLPAAAAVLPGRTRRGWLAVQAITALTVNHLLLTSW